MGSLHPWEGNMEPFRLWGNIYFVGTKPASTHIIDTGDGLIMIDPGYQHSLYLVLENMRKVGLNPMDIKYIVHTHGHIDHYDPETVSHFVHADSNVTILSPRSVWDSIRKAKGENNFVCVSSGVIWTAGDVEIRTVSAVHSDPFAVGFVLKTGEKRYYIAGDTLYSRQLAKEISEPIDVAFLPINGKGNNMNATDAAKLASELDAKLAIPVHFGMLDDLDATVFAYENKMIPEIYKDFEL